MTRPRKWDYATVAAVYMAGGERPTAAVAQTFGISRGAAAKLVARLRGAGFLPATDQGVPTVARFTRNQAEDYLRRSCRGLRVEEALKVLRSR